MTALSIRGIDKELSQKLKETSASQKTSINHLVLDILSTHLGLKKTKTFRTYNDLDSLAGTWSTVEKKNFDEAVKDFEKIEPGIWK